MQGDDDEEEDEDDDDEDARLDFSIPSSGAAKEYQLIVERCEALQQVCKTNNLSRCLTRSYLNSS